MTMKSAVAAGEYTEKVLTDNFTNIAKGFQSIDAKLLHLEGHISELYEMAQVTAKTAAKIKTPSRIKPFVVGAAVGVVIYRYTKNNRNKIEQIKRDAQARLDSIVNNDVDERSSTPA